MSGEVVVFKNREIMERRSGRRKRGIYGDRENGSDCSRAKGNNCEAPEQGAAAMDTRRRSCRVRKSANSREIPDESDNGFGGDKSECQRYKWRDQREEVMRGMAQLFSGGAGGELQFGTDVTLVSCEGDFVEGHKVVLALCSNYFRRLFAKFSRPLSKEPLVVVLGNVGTQTLRNLLKFMYLGEVDVKREEEHDFLEMAEFLELSGIGSGGHEDGSHSSFIDAGSQNKQTENVFKVRVVDKRVSLEESGSVPCKVESLEEEGEYSYDLEDFGGGEENDDCDWGGDADDPDFSFDDFTQKPSTGKKSNVRGGRKDVEDYLECEEPRIDPKSGKLKVRWTEVPALNDAEIAENWRLRKQSKGLDNYHAWVYYCAHGYRRCEAKLKKVLEDGETTFYSNQIEHSNHREVTRGIPPETKRFVVSMLEQGIRRVPKILKAMRLLQIELPSKIQIQNFIHGEIRRNGHKYPIPQRKQPPQERKGTPGSSRDTPKRRGRPPTSAYQQERPGFPTQDATKLNSVEPQPNQLPDFVENANMAPAKSEDQNSPSGLRPPDHYPDAN